MHTGQTTSELAPLPLPAAEREPWGSFLRSMFKVGINTFGGPVAQIGVMHDEAVVRRGWLTDGQFVHLINFANILPGPEALEIAIHLGYLRRGLRGGIAAGLLFIWPGFVTLTALGFIYTRFGKLAGVDAFFGGIRPVALALITFAVVRLSSRAIKGIPALLLVAVAFLAHFALGVPFLLLLLGCGLLGVTLGRRREGRSLGGAQVPLTVALIIAALLTGAIAHERSRPSELAPEGGRGAFVLEADAARLPQIAWINTKAALVTFGGAYTVLPYLHEQMVRQTGWLTDTHVMDALALGETTPGPLISFGIFLSYLAGGFPGAVVSCIFLFLPSFVLVLTLGRHIHRIETLPWAPGFLWGVSAGTIGLILSLSARIAPQNVAGPFEMLVAALALASLWLFKPNVIVVVLSGGTLGLLRLLLA